MHVVKGQHSQLGLLPSEEVHTLSPSRISHAVVSFVTISERVFERLYQVGLGRLRFLYSRRWILLAQHGGTERVLGVGNMSDELAEAADLVRRFIGIVRLG